MQLSDKRNDTAIIEKTVLLLIAVALNTLELFMPRLPFLPWLKPGLANSVTIIWIVRYGLSDAVLFTILRVWISGFYFGFSFLTLSLSLSGGIPATIVMSLLWYVAGRRKIIGTIGLGMVGAIVHNIGQLTAIYFLMAQNRLLFYQLPAMLVAAGVFGGLVGALASSLWKMTEKQIQNGSITTQGYLSNHKVRFKEILGSLFLFSMCLWLLFIESWIILSLIAMSISVGVIVITKSGRLVFRPLRFWVFFLFVAFMSLFFSYGIRIQAIPFLTKEGVHATTIQWLRLWIWLEATVILERFQFHHLLLVLLKRLFPNRTETIVSGIIAMEYFPRIVHFTRNSGISFLSLIRHPRTAFKRFIGTTCEHINKHFFSTPSKDSSNTIFTTDKSIIPNR